MRLPCAFNFGLKYDNDPANFNHSTIFNLQFNPVASVPKQNVEKAENNFLKIEEVRDLLCLDATQHFPADTYLLLKLC